MTSHDRELLAKVLGMLGSTHDGEVVAAARRAHRIILEAGVTWDEVIAGDQANLDRAVELLTQLDRENKELRAEVERLRSLAKPRPPRPWEDAETWQEGVDALLLWPEHLTQWELSFLTSLLHRRRYPTEKQFMTLKRVGYKVDRVIRGTWVSTQVAE